MDFRRFLRKTKIYINKEIDDLFYTTIKTDVTLDSKIIHTLGFTDDSENMYFIMDNIQGIHNTVQNKQLYMDKKSFQHFIIVADTKEIHEYFINMNRVIRLFCYYLNTRVEKKDDYFMVKVLTETMYSEMLKSFDIREAMIDLITLVYEYGDYQEQCNSQVIEIDILIEELIQDMSEYEDQLHFLMDETKEVLKQLHKTMK